MKNHIEISLEWMGRQVDLVVPSNVNAKRLIELVNHSFKANKQSLPHGWYFIVKGKSIALDSGQTLKELGLGDGEIFQLIVGENE
jgi:uncharacterized ubiquitin-like protein YukD